MGTAPTHIMVRAWHLNLRNRWARAPNPGDRWPLESGFGFVCGSGLCCGVEIPFEEEFIEEAVRIVVDGEVAKRVMRFCFAPWVPRGRVIRVG
jgi:hypothetical protein